jgi:hypothetical protein
LRSCGDRARQQRGTCKDGNRQPNSITAHKWNLLFDGDNRGVLPQKDPSHESGIAKIPALLKKS